MSCWCGCCIALVAAFVAAAVVAAAAAFGGASGHAACNLRPRKAGGISQRLIYIYIFIYIYIYTYIRQDIYIISRSVRSSSWGNDDFFSQSKLLLKANLTGQPHPRTHLGRPEDGRARCCHIPRWLGGS